MRRALSKAGDLAHGLKTPLAVLSHEADLAEAAGHHDMALTIGQQVERMRRQVDHHLAHARAAASGATPGTRCPVSESAEALARTLLRLHAGRPSAGSGRAEPVEARGVAIHVNVSLEHAVRGEREDVDEMLGNLLDNACKWARATVVISSSATDAGIVITVDDDGPGLDPSKREAVLQRGVRAAPLGGLRARLQLPAA